MRDSSWAPHGPVQRLERLALMLARLLLVVTLAAATYLEIRLSVR